METLKIIVRTPFKIKRRSFSTFKSLFAHVLDGRRIVKEVEVGVHEVEVLFVASFNLGDNTLDRGSLL